MASSMSLAIFLLLGRISYAAVCVPGSETCEAVTFLEAVNDTPSVSVDTDEELTAEARFLQLVEKARNIPKPGEVQGLREAFSAIETSLAKGQTPPEFNWDDFAANTSMLESLGLTKGGYQGEVCDTSKKCCGHDPNWKCTGRQCVPESFRLRVSNLCDGADGPRCAPGADKGWCDGECACPTNCAHKCGRCKGISAAGGGGGGGAGASCKKDCHGYTCDELSNMADPTVGNENKVLTCHRLKRTYGCSCDGCQCPAAKCAKACYDQTCDHWIKELGGQLKGSKLTCNRLAEEFGCDCTGCSCSAGGGSGSGGSR